MPFSIWEYLRERARDAVLAGIQDAMDAVEQDDTNGSQHAQANGLTSRLNPPKQLTATGSGSATSGATADTTTPETAQEAPQKATAAAPSPAPGKARPMPDEFDDELEKRLQDSASAPATATGGTTTKPTQPTKLHSPNGQPLKKRGRPRKDAGKDSTE